MRRNQIDDLAVFLRRIPFGAAPAILAGDFNFKPRQGSYHKFLREMPFTDVGAECLATRERCEVVLDPRPPATTSGQAVPPGERASQAAKASKPNFRASNVTDPPGGTVTPETTIGSKLGQ